MVERVSILDETVPGITDNRLFKYFSRLCTRNFVVSMSILRILSNFTNVIVTVMSYHGANEISKYLI